MRCINREKEKRTCSRMGAPFPAATARASARSVAWADGVGTIFCNFLQGVRFQFLRVCARFYQHTNNYMHIKPRTEPPRALPPALLGGLGPVVQGQGARAEPEGAGHEDEILCVFFCFLLFVGVG